MRPPDYQRGDVALYCGDAREIVPSLPSRSIDFVMTDPPYGHNNNNDDLIARWESALGRGEPGFDSLGLIAPTPPAARQLPLIGDE